MKNSEIPCTKEKAQLLLMKYCSGQEHCESELREKARNYGISQADTDSILQFLRDNKYFDHQRYALAFANDKFRFNKWGRIKIAHALKQKQISATEISLGLKAIDEHEYVQLLRSELEKKRKSIKTSDPYQQKAAIYRFAASRGFEPHLIQTVLESMQ